MASNIYPTPAAAGATYINLVAAKNTTSTSTTNVSVSATTSLPAGNYIVNYTVNTMPSVNMYIDTTPTSTQISLVSSASGAFFNLPTSGTTVTLTTPTSIGVWASSTANGSSGFYNSMTLTDTGFATIDSRRVNTTTDGTSWTTTTSNVSVSTTGTLYVLAFSTGTTNKWVAAGNGGQIYSSTDAITWTSRTSPSANAVYGGCGSPTATNKFVLVNTAGTLWYSTDAVTWTATAVMAAGQYGQSVAWGNSMYVAGWTNGNVYTSTNGTTWTARTTPVTGGAGVNNISYQNSLWFGYEDGASYLYSTDAITWTRVTQTWSSSGGNTPPSVEYLNGYYYTQGGAYGIYRTTSVASGWTNWGHGVTTGASPSYTVGVMKSNGSRIVTASGYYTTTGNLTIANTTAIMLTNTGTPTAFA